MDKTARKLFEKHLVNLLLNELKKHNEKAAIKCIKLVKDTSKDIAKKFAKSIKVLHEAKVPVKPHEPIEVKKTIKRKAIPKTQAKGIKKKR